MKESFRMRLAFEVSAFLTVVCISALVVFAAIGITAVTRGGLDQTCTEEIQR